jgi:hypothetical protein
MELLIMRFIRTTVALFSLLLLAACFAPSKADLLKKAKGVSSRAELEEALGEPSDVSKLGPIEKWTYKASDGSVVFVLAGDTVTIEATED